MRSENFVRLLYGVLSATACLAVICVPLGLAPSRAEPITASIAIGVLSAALSVAGFAAWRDLYPFAKWLVVAGLIAALFPALTFADPDASSHLGFWLMAVVPVTGFGLLGYLRLMGRRDPHQLLSKHPGRVFELDGIHLVFTAQREAPAGGTVQVEGALENCFSAPRSVTLHFEWRHALSSSVTQELAPNAVSHVRYSVPVPSHFHGVQNLLLTVDVKGLRGRRTKRLRGLPMRNRVRGKEQLVGLAVGVITWGGGLYFPVVIGPSTGERQVA